MTPQALETQILNFLQSDKVESECTKPEIERLFTGGVEFLRSVFPNPVIRRLATVVWEIVGQKITPVCWGIEVKTLSFVLLGPKSAPQAMILPPKDWANMLRRDPITQLGALVFVGSQAIDYANDRFTDGPNNVLLRAVAYEAEFLNTVKELTPEWEPVPYQNKILEEFPDGLATPKAQKVVYPVRSLIFA